MWRSWLSKSRDAPPTEKEINLWLHQQRIYQQNVKEAEEAEAKLKLEELADSTRHERSKPISTFDPMLVFKGMQLPPGMGGTSSRMNQTSSGMGGSGMAADESQEPVKTTWDPNSIFGGQNKKSS